MAEVSGNTKTVEFSFGLIDESDDTFTPYCAVHSANVLSNCSNYETLVTWLNNLGAWEYWLFQGNKTFGYDIEDSQEADRSSFEDWDSNFKQAETERFYADVKARIQRTFRAMSLTQSQAQALGSIVYSIHAQEFKGDGSKETVLFEKQSKEIRTEQEKLIDLEFSVRNTQRIPVQRQ